MKRLLLMRHGKTERGYEKKDFDRELVERGVNDSALVGRLIKNLEMVPDLVISSSARRALATAEIVAKNCGYSQTLEIQENFYLCPAETIINRLVQLPAETEIVLVVFHNPTLEELVSRLCADNKLNSELATGCLVYLQVYSRDWSKLKKAPAVLKTVTTPRVLKAIAGD